MISGQINNLKMAERFLLSAMIFQKDIQLSIVTEDF